MDGTTKSPSSFTGPIGKILEGDVSEWSVVNFVPIITTDVIVLPPDVVEDLSNDQNYGYRMCLAIKNGLVSNELGRLNVGPISHSRWLTLACRILRLYVSQTNPDNNLATLAKYCIQVYFPTWFDIKQKNYITHGSRHFFNLVKRNLEFAFDEIVPIVKKVINNNSYFAHPENVLLAMLGDEDASIRFRAVDKVLSIRNYLRSEESHNRHDLYAKYSEDGTSKLEFVADNQSSYKMIRPVGKMKETMVRKFQKPEVNFEATIYHEMIKFEDCSTEPPVLKRFTNEEISGFKTSPLMLKYPCHNQAVERHVKLVTQASNAVSTFARRDGMIRQQIKSRKIMKKFETKQDFRFKVEKDQ